MPPATHAVRHASKSLSTWLGFATGLLALVLAWSVPVHLSSIAPALLERAGGPDLATLARERLDQAQPGPAALLREGARAAALTTQAETATAALAAYALAEPALMPWGGDAPFLRPLALQPAGRLAALAGESVPVVRFFLTDQARASLRAFLAGSRLAAVRDTLALSTLRQTGAFPPASRPGGQTFDALLLLAALLHQGEHLSPSLARSWHEDTRASLAAGSLAPSLETTLVDLLSLARRLDWRQLAALAASLESPAAWSDLARLSRQATDTFHLAAAASLASGSTEKTLAYLRSHPDAAADLTLALRTGQGAVRLLLDRAVPVNRQGAPAPGPLVGLALLHPDWALALRFALAAGGAYLLLRALDRWCFRSDPDPAHSAAPGSLLHLRAGLPALLATAAFILVTEPHLSPPPTAAPDRIALAMPVLGQLSDPASLRSVTPTFTMDLHSLLAIGLFTALQIGMYLLCLGKIRQIDALAVSPLVKLRLMENEENLFDGGLYLGIGGTATALVLQVLGLVEPNLLAAYSSNLLGITCVALVKIRHVRPYKTTLILAAQDAIAAGPAPAPASPPAGHE